MSKKSKPSVRKERGHRSLHEVVSLPELPKGFGDDELSRQMRRNAESFDTWWARNHPWDWWRKARRGKALPHRDRLRVWQLVKAAYDRQDLAG